MLEEISFLLVGATFGLSAGLSPGPLLPLAINQTISYGKKEGIKIALAPALTDLPIILVCTFLISQLANANSIIGLISILGSLLVAYFAYKSLTIKGIEIRKENTKPESIKKGIITNILNPNPYLFWIAVGGPILIKAFDVNLLSAILFVNSRINNSTYFTCCKIK